MIVTEELIIKDKLFIKSFSSLGYMVERDGAAYSEAIDPAEFNRIYTETNILVGEKLIVVYSQLEEEEEYATEEDYVAALEKLGVNADA